MTEEIRTETTPPESKIPQILPEIAKRGRRTYTIGIAALTLMAFVSAIQFAEFNNWTILASAVGILISVAILIASNILYNRGRIQTATNLVPVTILVTFVFSELFLAGMTLYNLITGLLLIILTFISFRPKNIRYWLYSSVIYIVTLPILNQLNIFNRFDVSIAPFWTTTLLLTSALLAVLILWQIFTNMPVRSIRTRLLLAFVGIGLIPGLIISATSTLIGYQRDLTQAETNLNTILNLRTEQLAIWRQQIDNDIAALQQNPLFISNIDFLLNYTPTESYEANLRQEVHDTLSGYVGEGTRFSSISVVDRDGFVIISTQPEYEYADFSENPLYTNGRFYEYNTPLTLNTSSKEIEFSVAKPVFNANEDLIGIMIATVYTDELSELMQEYLGSDSRKSYLVSTNESLLTPLTPGDTAAIGSTVALNFIEGDETTQAMANFNAYTNTLGDRVIGVYQYNNELKTYIIIEQNQEEAFQSLQLNLIINSGLAILTFIAIIIVSVRSARSISAPLALLSDEAAQVSNKELNLIEPLDRDDEIGQLSQSLSTMTAELMQTTINLEQVVAERTKVLERRAAYLETTSEISKALTGIYNLDDLLNTVAFLISENFGFYHVGIFLLDAENEYAELKASNSEGGWRMLARNHKLKVGEQGIVGFVTGSGLPRIQQQVEGEESVYYNNPDLPLTKSEMALPLKVGNEIFGALDVQDTKETAFTDEDISALQVLADSVAVAIQNTRLVQQLQESLETERRIYGDLTSSSWRNLLSSTKAALAFRSNQQGVQSISESSPPIAQKALQTGRSEIEQAKDISGSHKAAIPIRVRGGAVVAVIETQKPAANGPWTTEEITILESVGAELGMAIENARLFEETQKTAQRERISANLSSQIWASADVENILQTTIRELGSALNISYGTIKLRLPEEEGSNGKLDGVDQE